MKPPRAYDLAYEVLDPQLWHTVRVKRAKDNFKKYNYVNPKMEIENHEIIFKHKLHKDPHKSKQDYAGEIITTKRLQMRSKI